LRKSDAVRDILKSLALINDPLKRAALAQQLAGICEMEEAVLVQELAKLVKQQQAKENQEFEKEVKSAIEGAGASFGFVEGGSGALRVNLLDHKEQELAVFRILLLYAEQSFVEGKSVFDFVWDELAQDDLIEFEHDLCVKLEQEVRLQSGWPGQKFFVHHIDPEIAAWSAGVLAEGYPLSQAYADNYIDVKDESLSYREQVFFCI
jgi:hypothetical protein